MDVRVARRYAKALYDVAEQAGAVPAVEEDLIGVASVMDVDDRFRMLMRSPTIDRDTKLRVVERAFGDKVNALTMQTLRLLLRKRREAEFISIKDEFIRIRREKSGIVLVKVTSAEPLSDKQQEGLVKKLSAQFGKAIETTFDVDKALIGGIRVSYDNYVLDGSVRGGLSRLRESLKRDLLKQA